MALALGAAPPLQAWEDPFNSWKASLYAQFLQLDRPEGGQPGAYALDSNGGVAGGYRMDGLYVRKIESKLSGGLGWEGWSMTLGLQTDLNSTGITDIFAAWIPGLGSLEIKAGQARLPFGIEQQISSSRLLGIQRSLASAYGNYGHVGDWGMGLLNERGQGLRADLGLPLGGPLSLTLQAAAMSAAGFSINSALAGVGRAALRFQVEPLALEMGFSGYGSRANLQVADLSYAPLGAAANLDPSAWESGAGLGTRSSVLAWGPDASLDFLFLHGRAEWAVETLGASLRGGGQLSAWAELPGWERRKPYVYGKWEQAWTNFGDGIHRPGSLYRVSVYGISSPLPWEASLKIEDVRMQDDDFSGPFPGSEIYQAQCQWEL